MAPGLFNVFSDAEAHQGSGHFRLPKWLSKWLPETPFEWFVSVAVLLFTITTIGFFAWNAWGPVSSSEKGITTTITETQAQTESAQPVPNVQKNIATAPVIPEVELLWVEIGIARSGAEARALPIPGERFTVEVVSSPLGYPIAGMIYWKDLNLPVPAVGKGDGTAFLVKTSEESPRYLLTSNRGKDWESVSPPSFQSTAARPAIGSTGAFIENGVTTSYMYTEIEPLVLKYWQAKR